MTCKLALSNLIYLGRSQISGVDCWHSWTLRVMEKVLIQGQATLE